MARLWIGNVAPDTSDDEIKALLVKYGFPEYDAIEHVPGDGSRPAVVVTYEAADPTTLEGLQARLQNLFWKNRRLHVSVVSDSRWTA